MGEQKIKAHTGKTTVETTELSPPSRAARRQGSGTPVGRWEVLSEQVAFRRRPRRAEKARPAETPEAQDKGAGGWSRGSKRAGDGRRVQLEKQAGAGSRRAKEGVGVLL